MPESPSRRVAGSLILSVSRVAAPRLGATRPTLTPASARGAPPAPDPARSAAPDPGSSATSAAGRRAALAPVLALTPARARSGSRNPPHAPRWPQVRRTAPSQCTPQQPTAPLHHQPAATRLPQPACRNPPCRAGPSSSITPHRRLHHLAGSSAHCLHSTAPAAARSTAQAAAHGRGPVPASSAASAPAPASCTPRQPAAPAAQHRLQTAAPPRPHLPALHWSQAPSWQGACPSPPKPASQHLPQQAAACRDEPAAPRRTCPRLPASSAAPALVATRTARHAGAGKPASLPWP